MGKSYLIAVDLEGVHGVVGEPYKGLSLDCSEYKLATENAVLEVNAAVKGLCDGGAQFVAVWDNHGGRDNMDFSKIDSRVVKVKNPPKEKFERLALCDGYNFDGILYIGYHAKEGSLNGVLAHTYSSKEIQYFKVNGRAVGELDVDSWAAAERNIPPLFCASDSVGVSQALEIEPNMKTVITKCGTGRNSAHFNDRQQVLKEIEQKAFECVSLCIEPKKLTFPATMEVRFTRAEDAFKKMQKILAFGQKVEFGEDNHVLVGTLNSFKDLESFL